MFIPEKIKRNTKKKQNRRFYYIDSNPDLKNEPKLPKKRITQNCPPKGISRVGNSDIHHISDGTWPIRIYMPKGGGVFKAELLAAKVDPHLKLNKNANPCVTRMKKCQKFSK